MRRRLKLAARRWFRAHRKFVHWPRDWVAHVRRGVGYVRLPEKIPEELSEGLPRAWVQRISSD